MPESLGCGAEGHCPEGKSFRNVLKSGDELSPGHGFGRFWAQRDTAAAWSRVGGYSAFFFFWRRTRSVLG